MFYVKLIYFRFIHHIPIKEENFTELLNTNMITIYMFYCGNSIHVDNSIVWNSFCTVGDHSCNVRDRACIKNDYFAFFTLLNRTFLGLFWFCNFFHGMPGFKRTTSFFKTAEQCELKLLYRRCWQLFNYMYHANANLFQLVSLSSLNIKKFNNSYNPLTG